MQPSEVNNQRILIACLNWGKGHVSRSIGLIHQLLNQDNQLFIAADIEQKKIFECYFPTVNYLKIPSYPFRFSGNGNFAVDIWKSRKNILKAIQIEQEQVENWVKEHDVSLVISDHRYGFRSKSSASIFVTHQLNLPITWWQKPVQWWHTIQLKKFKQIWVMDSNDSFLAGKLSKNKRFMNLEYIGYYSRFMFQLKVSETEKQLDLVVCSGPSPYDEQLLLVHLNDSKKLIICSPALASNYPQTNVIAALNWIKIDELMLKARIIYSYSGYSTLMDVHFLKCQTKLSATIGQAEQTYLLDLHSK